MLPSEWSQSVLPQYLWFSCPVLASASTGCAATSSSAAETAVGSIEKQSSNVMSRLKTRFLIKTSF